MGVHCLPKIPDYRKNAKQINMHSRATIVLALVVKEFEALFS
jgi:hypothetical protein